VRQANRRSGRCTVARLRCFAAALALPAALSREAPCAMQLMAGPGAGAL